MLATNNNSYLKEYVRRRSVSERASARPTNGVEPHSGRLLTDRGEYIAFLESQLDAVTRACLSTQSFDERLTSLGAAACTLDEKLLNLARLVKCSQSVAEEQEAVYHAALERMGERVRANERALATLTETESDRVLQASAMLRGKGLLSGDDDKKLEGGRGGAKSYGGGGGGERGAAAAGAMDVGVLDAQFRTWAQAQERSIDARLDAAEARLAARVDTATANVLEALRATEHRLREAAPQLADECARRIWGAGPERGAFPAGGVVGKDDLISVTRRVEALEALERRLLLHTTANVKEPPPPFHHHQQQQQQQRRQFREHGGGGREGSRDGVAAGEQEMTTTHRQPRAGPPYAAFLAQSSREKEKNPIHAETPSPEGDELTRGQHGDHRWHDQQQEQQWWWQRERQHDAPIGVKSTSFNETGSVLWHGSGGGGPVDEAGGSGGGDELGEGRGSGGDSMGLGTALVRSVEASAARFQQLGTQFASFHERLEAQQESTARLAQLVEQSIQLGSTNTGVIGGGGGDGGGASSGQNRDINNNDDQRGGDKQPAALLMAQASSYRAAKMSSAVVQAVRSGASGVRDIGGPSHTVSSQPVSPPRSSSKPGGSRVNSSGASTTPAKVPTTTLLVLGGNNRPPKSTSTSTSRSTTIAAGVSGSSNGSAADIYTTKTVAETEARHAKLAQLYQRLDEITSPPNTKD